MAPDLDYLGLVAGQKAERVLTSGFTSICDVDGP
jgi:hypothetical protein